jgi:hypothetical protein
VVIVRFSADSASLSISVVMGRPSTPPRSTKPAPAVSPPTPEVTKRIVSHIQLGCTTHLALGSLTTVFRKKTDSAQRRSETNEKQNCEHPAMRPKYQRVPVASFQQMMSTFRKLPTGNGHTAPYQRASLLRGRIVMDATRAKRRRYGRHASSPSLSITT